MVMSYYNEHCIFDTIWIYAVLGTKNSGMRPSGKRHKDCAASPAFRSVRAPRIAHTMGDSGGGRQSMRHAIWPDEELRLVNDAPSGHTSSACVTGSP